MSCYIEVNSEREDVIIIRFLCDKLTTAEDLEAAGKELYAIAEAKNETPPVLLHCDLLRQIGRPLITKFEIMEHHLAGNHRALLLCCLTPEAKEVFHAHRMYESFKIFASCEGAILSLVPSLV